MRPHAASLARSIGVFEDPQLNLEGREVTEEGLAPGSHQRLWLRRHDPAGAKRRSSSLRFKAAPPRAFYPQRHGLCTLQGRLRDGHGANQERTQ